jgi:hypothetical protein
MESWCLRAGRLGAGLTLVFLAACGPSTTGPGATASSSSSSSSSGASGTSSSSGATSSSSGGLCPPVACALACPFGFAPGADGCLTCSCLPDPRPCGALDAQDCAQNANCAAVSFQNGTGGQGFQCCARLPDGTIRCADEPPPPVCMQDNECRPGQTCNTWDYCELPPGCDPTQGCPAVCYGRCVTGGGGGGCVSDYDCSDTEHCAFGNEPAPCPDPNSGACAQRYEGTCEPVACPAIAPICPNGQPPPTYVNVPHGCPIPVCEDVACDSLPPEQCELRRDCQAVYTGEDCACRCDATTGECPPCVCPPPAYQCISRPSCFSDLQCNAGEYCDFTYDDCVNCGRPAMGICVPSTARCDDLSQEQCSVAPGCTPIYGEVCPACQPGSSCPPCMRAYLGCRPDDTVFCSRDVDCGPGMQCNLCPGDPNCPNCDVCGAPVCEPAPPPDRCSSDAQCGPGLVCAFDVCTASEPAFCVGSCVPAPTSCTGLDERTCSAAPNCEPVYDQGCTDGCHDDQGRITSCGPCLAIACPPARFVACEPARFDACCSDAQCGFGLRCQFTRDINVGECAPDTTACGPDGTGTCPAGSACEIIGCGGNGEPSPGGAGCAPLFACVPVSGCTSDDQCGPGMRCNTCPPDPTCPMCAVCGPAQCESIPAGSCRTSEDCAPGCGCRPGPNGMGSCAGPADEACPGRTFRTCSDDSQCLPDEMCQRCPPGAACFVADHCVPRDRPVRTCGSDAECLPDEHCGDTCEPNAMCDQVPHCVPGSPTLRTCGSNLECRPDEYCQMCPPNALCLLPDHCEPRTFRICDDDSQCLPDEGCTLCPPGGVCPYAGRCELRTFRTCDMDTDCLAGERCEMCPPGALCLVADHCVPAR